MEVVVSAAPAAAAAAASKRKRNHDDDDDDDDDDVLDHLRRSTRCRRTLPPHRCRRTSSTAAAAALLTPPLPPSPPLQSAANSVPLLSLWTRPIIILSPQTGLHQVPDHGGHGFSDAQLVQAFLENAQRERLRIDKYGPYNAMRFAKGHEPQDIVDEYARKQERLERLAQIVSPSDSGVDVDDDDDDDDDDNDWDTRGTKHGEANAHDEELGRTMGMRDCNAGRENDSKHEPCKADEVAGSMKCTANSQIHNVSTDGGRYHLDHDGGPETDDDIRLWKPGRFVEGYDDDMG
ncbi:hypothetical protein Slin15195_G130820 [Septoria linicola]|uniref:Uncharacterized protein n=1 Tax=Septoria linicola TaxID=215465 RepID=A0A9Q9ESM8_9PEZI|nr:hypothetical protein Slin15195_G130820 [Septoria linicola]